MLDFFAFARVQHTQSSHIFVSLLAMGVLHGRVDQESSHDTSMLTTRVDHVVGLSVLHISQVSSLG